MVMYGGAVALTPTQGHQVVLTIALVHKIPRVPVSGTILVYTGCDTRTKPYLYWVTVLRDTFKKADLIL